MNPVEETINEGDQVVLYSSRTLYELITVTKGQKFQNRLGLFLHESVIGKHYGDMVCVL